MIWDEVTYNPEVEVGKGGRREVTGRDEAERVAAESLATGNVKVRLYGKKLKGSFALVKTKGFGGNKEAWLLMKHRDSHSRRGYDANDDDVSARSGRSMAQIAGQGVLGTPEG